MRRRIILKVVEPGASPEVFYALKQRAREARDGDLIGIAYVALYRGHDYAVEILGETRRAPTFTRGMLCLLDDQLAALLSTPK